MSKPSDNLDFDAIFARVDASSTQRVGLVRAFSALQLPNPRGIRPTAQRLIAISAVAGWLPEELAKLIGVGDPIDTFHLVLTDPEASWGSRHFSTRGVTAAAGIYAALRDHRSRPPAGLEQLRALLVLAAVWQFNRTPNRLDPDIGSLAGPIGGLAQSIRAMENRLNHPLHSLTAKLGDAPNPDDLANRISAHLQRTDERRARDFRSSWKPLEVWLRGAVWRIPILAPPPLEARRVRTRTTVYRERGQFSVALGSQPELPFAPEPSSESDFGIQLIEPETVPAGIALPTLRHELSLARQHIRLQNTALLPDHIQVLSRPERLLLVACLNARIETDALAGHSDDLRLATVIQLCLATGLLPDLIVRIPLTADRNSEPTHGYSLCQTTGTLQMSVLAPADRFKPGAHRHLFEPVEDVVELPLPPCVVRSLTLLPKSSSTVLLPESLNWPEGELDTRLRAYLRTLDGLPASAVNLARIRRLFHSQVQQISGDLTITMLLSGDTLGRSDAPLFYYAPRRSDLQRAYVEAAWPLFEDVPVPPPAVAARVGAAGLARPNAVRDRVRALCAQLNLRKSIRGKSQSAWLSLMHNRLVNLTLAAVACVTTHRPSRALLGLTRWDLDLVGHSAVCSDKRTDPAHRVRFAATTPQLSEQLGLYLAHLKALIREPAAAGKSTPLGQSVAAVLAGEAALFFHLDEALRPVELTEIGIWHATLPSGWRELQPNWYRTVAATQLRELGVPPLAVCTQLGHLDAAGYPFAQDSCLSPLGFADAIRPGLQRLWQEQGWQLRSGLAPAPDDPISDLPPLEDWAPRLEEQRREQVAADAALRVALRARRKSARAAAEPVVRQHLAAERPALAWQLDRLLEKRPRPGRTRFELPYDADLDEPGTLGDEALMRLRTANDEAAGADTVARIAMHNVLCMLLRRARTELGWITSDIRLWLPGPGAKPAPFLRGMMKARMQVHAMRRHIAANSVPARGTELYARCALWLLLFTPYAEVDAACSMLASLKSASRTTRLRDALLVEQVVGNRREIYGVRGLAALVLDGAAAGDLTAQPPDGAMLADHIAQLLPPWAAGAGGELLARLSSTLSINQIIEESPLARLALGDGRCTSAPMPDQLGMLDDTPIDGETRVPMSQGILPRATRSGEPSPPNLAELNRQYRTLTGLLNVSKGASKYLPLSDVHLSSGKGAVARTALLSELRLYLDHSTQAPDGIVRALTLFALELVEHGTPQRLAPAPATVQTYVTTIGSRLMEIAPQVELQRLGTDEFEALYETVLEPFAGRSAARAAAQVFAFHDLMMRELEVEDFDRSEFGVHFAQQESGVDARLVTPAEYRSARDALMRAADTAAPANPSAPPEARRLDRACAVALILLQASGARVSEICMLRHCDLVLANEAAALLIRPTAYSWLKTPAARRMVNLDGRLTAGERAYVSAWMHDERSLRGARFDANRPLLGMIDNPDLPIPMDHVCDRMREVLKATTQRECRLHQLRHLWASRALAEEMLSEQSGQHALRGPDLARAVAVQIGHRTAVTTVGCYFHLPWVLSSHAASLQAEHLERHHLAAASNRTLASVDKIALRATVRRGHGAPLAGDDQSIDTNYRWLTSILDMGAPVTRTDRAVMLAPAEATANALAYSLTPLLIEQLFRSASDAATLSAVCRAHGITDATGSRLVGAAEELEALCRYRLLSTPDACSKVRAEARPRPFGGNNPFLPLLKTPEEPEDQQRLSRIAQIFAQSFRPSVRGGLRLLHRDAVVLSAAVQAIGLDNGRALSVRIEASAERRWIFSIGDGSTGLALSRLLHWTLAIVCIYDWLADEDPLPANSTINHQTTL